MRFSLRTGSVVTAIVGAAVLTTVASGPQAIAATAPVSKTASVSTKNEVLAGAKKSIDAMVAKSSASDTQYFSGGRFQYNTFGVDCARCELGPAVAAAALYRRTGETKYRTLAVTAMDTAIRNKQLSNGFFVADNDTIDTAFFAEHVGAMLFYFGPTLDSAHRAAYVKSLAKAADALLAVGILSYYVNGNINLAATVGLGMAWQQTGSATYKAAYEASLSFTLAPKGRWKSYGLRVTKKGTKTLGRDSSAYLVEVGAGGTGFDPEYAQVQADFAADGYQILGDTRLLTLSNQLNNQVMPLVDTKTWTYDTSRGSRHNRPVGARDRYTTPAFYLDAVATSNSLAASQATAMTQLMRDSSVIPWGGVYQSWGNKFAALIYGIK